MADDRTRRFAKLPKPAAGAASGRRGPERSLDLFEHFGVPTEPAPGPARALAEPVPVLPCPECGWFRATPLVEPCPVCAAPPRDGTGA